MGQRLWTAGHVPLMALPELTLLVALLVVTVAHEQTLLTVAHELVVGHAHLIVAPWLLPLVVVLMLKAGPVLLIEALWLLLVAVLMLKAPNVRALPVALPGLTRLQQVGMNVAGSLWLNWALVEVQRDL